MTDNKIENFSEHQLRKAKADLEKDEEIQKFENWVHENGTQEFTITSDYGMSYEFSKKKKDHIRDILMTMPDNNGYYIPPYE